MYIIKVKGTNKIPNYIQLRDEDFTLVGYFSWKEGRPLRQLDKYGLEGKEEALKSFIEKMPFGKLVKLEI